MCSNFFTRLFFFKFLRLIRVPRYEVVCSVHCVGMLLVVGVEGGLATHVVCCPESHITGSPSWLSDLDILCEILNGTRGTKFCCECPLLHAWDTVVAKKLSEKEETFSIGFSQLFLKLLYIIGASTSEPHSQELNSKSVTRDIYRYIYIYRRVVTFL